MKEHETVKTLYLWQFFLFDLFSLSHLTSKFVNLVKLQEVGRILQVARHTKVNILTLV